MVPPEFPTAAFAVLLAIGGTMGYIKKHSVPSLAGGVGSAVVLLLLAGHMAAQRRRSQPVKLPLISSLLLSGALSLVMFLRYHKTGAFFPSGLTCGLSALMAVFYGWCLTTSSRKVD